MSETSELSMQQTFDRVWNHFVVNKAPRSSGPSGECMYRGDRGAKCAAGLFIPDEKYRVGLEGKSCAFVMVAEAIEGANMTILPVLQRAHDDIVTFNFHTDIETRLRLVASQYKLVVPTPSPVLEQSN